MERKIKKILNEIELELDNKEITPAYLVKIFKKKLLILFPGIKFIYFRNRSVKKGEIILNGYTILEYWNRKDLGIRIEFIINNKQKYINIKNWKSFKFDIKQTLLHELVHRKQAIKTKGKMIIDFDSNLDNIYEIEAHANDIILELKRYYSQKEIQRKLKNISCISKEDSLTLWVYKTNYSKKIINLLINNIKIAL